MQPDIVEPPGLHMLERADHAVDERLAADKAVTRPHLRLPRQMLARAEADLKLQWALIAEQRL